MSRGGKRLVSRKAQAIVDDPGWRPCQVPTSDRNTPKERERACFSPMLSRARARNGPAPQLALAGVRRADVWHVVMCPGGQRTSRSGSPALARLLAQHDSNQTRAVERFSKLHGSFARRSHRHCGNRERKLGMCWMIQCIAAEHSLWVKLSSVYVISCASTCKMTQRRKRHMHAAAVRALGGGLCGEVASVCVSRAYLACVCSVPQNPEESLQEFCVIRRRLSHCP